nr:hypothetical protein [Tanacetum cinerariifolium]
GTEGVIGLTRWFERTESVSSISNYTAKNQMMTVKYCPRGEVKKLEVELWNLKVKGTDITSYTLRFQELTLLCGRIFPEERNNNVAQAYDAGSGEKPYRGTKPRTGHIARDCRSRAANTNNNNNNNYNNQRATSAYQGVPTYFKCGAQGHFKNNYLKLGNKNQGNRNQGNKNQGNQNQAGNGNAVVRAYGLGTEEGNPDANVVTGTFLL